MVDQIERDSAVAFRLQAHHLDGRLPEHDLLRAAGECGIQNTPPGSALLSFHARVEGVSAPAVDQAVDDKSLLLTWSMRGAPYYLPTRDAEVFTQGVLPVTEEAQRHFIVGIEYSLDRLNLRLSDVVDLVTVSTHEVIHGRRLAITDLGAEVADHVAPGLTPRQRDIWDEEGPHATGQPIGQAVVHFCLRILALRQVVCFAPRTANTLPFVLIEEWLGDHLTATHPEASRAELLRRYLHCYGPSTPANFAAWLGVRASEVDPWWSLLGDELVPVAFGGGAWLLDADRDAIGSAQMPTGIRMLPARDPYLQLRDRATIVDRAYHRDVWKTSGDPGVLLHDGEVVGTWRQRKNGTKLRMGFATFAAMEPAVTEQVAAEAERIATLRGSTSLSVEFASY